MRRTRRRRKNQSSDEVQLNMAAMLDMAFQLLAFFILTFRSSPVEAQIQLRLPDKPQITSAVDFGSSQSTAAEDFDLALTIELYSQPNGHLDRIVIGSNALKSTDPSGTTALFREKMKSLFETPFTDSIVIKVDKALYYEYLMQVVDTCTRQTTTDGSPMTKISIVTLK